MNILDIFSGIGGLSLGLQRAGFRTVCFCEIDRFCRSVLAKHWPGVPIHDDVRTLTADRLRADGIADVDVIAGGFPCQDISLAGQRAGMDGDRSGLWVEFARLIGELRPQYAIVENVPGLLSDGLGRVLGDLAEIGFDAEWHCIPASAVGAPHRRDRVWIVAHSQSERCANGYDGTNSRPADRTLDASPMPGGLVRRLETWRWPDEPGLGRVAHGVPDRVDRLAALGNAVVPQIPELIGRAILESRAPP